MVIAPARPMVLHGLWWKPFLWNEPPNRLLAYLGETPLRCVGNEARAQNRAHELFRVEQERENLSVYDEWNSVEPGRSFKFHIFSVSKFFLDDAECRRNIRRPIDDSAFMKKARLHPMQPSPIHCPPRRFLNFPS